MVQALGVVKPHLEMMPDMADDADLPRDDDGLDHSGHDHHQDKSGDDARVLSDQCR